MSVIIPEISKQLSEKARFYLLNKLKKYTTIVLVAATCVMVFDCKSFGSDFQAHKVSKIVIGQTSKKELVEIFGAHKERIIFGNENNENDIFRFSFIQAGNFRILDVEFSEGLVTGYLLLSNSAMSRFNFSKRKELKIQSMNKDDIISLLGKPSGEARIPTSLLRHFRVLPGFSEPEDYHSALIYYFVEPGELGPRQRVLICYFDDKLILKKFYFHYNKKVLLKQK